MKKGIVLAIGLLLTAGLAFSNGTTEQAASAADFPTKTIEVYMSWPPGGSSDTQARVLLDDAESVFGQSVVIIDKSGAGGTKSAMATKLAKPDGYTVMWASGGQFTMTPLNIDVDYSIDDFKTVCGVTIEPTLVVTAKDSGIETLDDLKDYSGKITYGSPGASSGPGAAIGLLMKKMGVKAEHVPFGGSNESSVAALGGHVLISDSRTPLVESMDGLRVLCVLSSERSASLPDVPTAKELGYDVVLESYNGFYVPKDTPDEIVDKLAAGFEELKAKPDFVEFLKNSKIDVCPWDKDELREKVVSESAFFKQTFGTK